MFDHDDLFNKQEHRLMSEYANKKNVKAFNK